MFSDNINFIYRKRKYQPDFPRLKTLLLPQILHVHTSGLSSEIIKPFKFLQVTVICAPISVKQSFLLLLTASQNLKVLDITIAKLLTRLSIKIHLNFLPASSTRLVAAT